MASCVPGTDVPLSEASDNYEEIFMSLSRSDQKSVCEYGRVFCRQFYQQKVRATVRKPEGETVTVCMGPNNYMECHIVEVPWEKTFEAEPSTWIVMQVDFKEVMEADMSFYVNDLPVGSFVMQFKVPETVSPMFTHLVGL
jgi:hypothetical protein